MSIPNPGAPGSNQTTKKPSALARLGPRILAGGTVLGLIYTYYATKAPRVAGAPPPPNPLRTPGVANIEGAYQKGGATSTHTKGYGGTTMGEKEDIPRDQGYGSGKDKGFGGEHLGSDQRPDTSGKVGEKWKELKYGSGKDK